MVGASFLDHGHQPVLVGVACELGVGWLGCSSAVTFCWSEHGRPMESVSSTIGHMLGRWQGLTAGLSH